MKFHLPLGVHYVIGHTRMTTQGSEKQNCNNHPFRGLAGRDKFALAHNVVLCNDHILQKVHHLPATPIKTDSYAAVQLLEKYGELSFDSLTAMVSSTSLMVHRSSKNDSIPLRFPDAGSLQTKNLFWGLFPGGHSYSCGDFSIGSVTHGFFHRVKW